MTNASVPDEPAPPTTGYIKLVKKAEGTGTPFSGAVFGVYEKATDVKVAELTTGSDGTALSGELPASAYYLLERTAPSGFALNTEKTGATVSAGEPVEVTVYNAAQSSGGDGGVDTGWLRLITRRLGRPESGEAVHGYEIIRAVTFDNQRGFAIGLNPNAVKTFVAWQFTMENGRRDYYWGHYADEFGSAAQNYALPLI